MTLKRFFACAAVGVALVLAFYILPELMQSRSTAMLAPHNFLVRPHVGGGGRQPVFFNWKPLAIGAIGLALIFFTKNDKAQNAGGVLVGAAATALLT